MSLSKTVALVTGGASGLGAATVKALRAQGARVWIADLDVDKMDAEYEGGPSHWSKVDVTDPASVTTCLDEMEKEFDEPLNACIQCAGVGHAFKTITSKGIVHPLVDFERVLRINTSGTFNVARLAAERMKKTARPPGILRGCIINTASIAAYEGQCGQVAYSASKGAIVGMTLPMARDLAPLGIRVMTIAPGLFLTPLLEGLPPAVQQQLGANVPCPTRLGKPDEFAQLVMHVLQNEMLNGSVIRLDGALRMPP